MKSVANYISLQTEILELLINPSGAYIIIGGDDVAITDSRISAELPHALSSVKHFKSIFPKGSSMLT